ncbi:GDSL esterase/lipase At5g03980-like [Chenopodium quinoa]|uniref:GDSL esterase/lipase At5g03980-like n=1 Tax=Chenopodium quinoa TaxID=63459 RepID=UPI000B79AC12|nr:GDSL esterase/lipase At5g03980-like [Chenopodium quinoa]
MEHFLFRLFMQSLLLSSVLLCASATNITRDRNVVGDSLVSKRDLIRLTRQIEAIYQFGDSLSDTGNYIREVNGEESTYSRLPYGQSYHPTGRASDGLIMVDYIAMFFHLPLLNPYLAKGSDFRHGANFAVIGATANGKYNSLGRQLDWFKYHLRTTYHNSIAIKRKLQKSLVLMGEIGGNDFNGPFNQGKSIKEVAKLVPGVVQTIKNAIEEVIKLGATNIVVPGNFPIGCVPLYLAKFATNDTSKYDKLWCLKDYNNFAKFYNIKLIRAIKQLQQKHPDVAIVYGDYYSALIWVIANAQQLGIEQDDTKKACCGYGYNPYNFGTTGCGSPGSPICQDPSKRISWDGIHLTQQGYKGVGDQLLEQFVPVLEKQIRRRLRKPIR